MANKRTLKVEDHQRYFGSIQDVIKQVENCPSCGAKLEFTHLPDLQNLYIHEEVECSKCNYGVHETLHVLN